MEGRLKMCRTVANRVQIVHMFFYEHLEHHKFYIYALRKCNSIHTVFTMGTPQSDQSRNSVLYAPSSVDTRECVGKAYPTRKAFLGGIVFELGKSEEFSDAVFKSFCEVKTFRPFIFS
jgi:hypothetical protein